MAVGSRFARTTTHAQPIAVAHTRIFVNTDALRIIDVNVNRAREALRVIEDYARFTLDDANAGKAAKCCRHDLRAIVRAVGQDRLLDARDIVADVGRDVKTDTELCREDVESVVRAAFARLSEAMRGLGEYAKLIDADAAALAETLRYKAYELEQRVVLRGHLRQRLAKSRTYVLLTESLCRRPWLDTLGAVIAAGANIMQLREKSIDDGELLQRCRTAREATRAAGVLLAINDRPDLARLVGADIVHVGQDDLPVREVRHIAGAGVLVGKSTHTVEQFDSALAEAPDYLAIGPMFQSTTKPQGHIAGTTTLAAVRSRTDLPIVAIGGIDADNVAEVCAAGANVVAVCSEVIACDDPESAMRRLCGAISASTNG